MFEYHDKSGVFFNKKYIHKILHELQYKDLTIEDVKFYQDKDENNI